MTRTAFADRNEAGRELATRLDSYRGSHPVVLALPRGGVPVAIPVVQALDAELDLLMVRKIGLPTHPELAMGAVAAIAGRVEVVGNPRVIQVGGVSDDTFEDAVRRELAELTERELRYRGGRDPLEVSGRTVIVVDDGLATGATLRAGLAAVRRCGPAELVAAVPVGSKDGLAQVQFEVDNLFYVATPSPFYAVGQAYRDFHECSDSEVIELIT
jgi:putative phosphoribosyl transferase